MCLPPPTAGARAWRRRRPAAGSCEAAATLSRRGQLMLPPSDKERRTRFLVYRPGLLILDTLILLASSPTYQRLHCFIPFPLYHSHLRHVALAQFD